MNKKGSAEIGFVLIIMFVTLYVSLVILSAYEDYSNLKPCDNLGNENCERDICRYNRVTNEDTESAVTACLVVLNNNKMEAENA